MVITPYYLRTLLEVAELEPDFGIVRGTSDYVDCFPQHQVRPPLPIRGITDIFNFSKLVRTYEGLHCDDDDFLTGDAFLVKRVVLDRIGVMDSRYFGYFGDIDFGLRAQRAGFRLGCAKGAWLRHVGAAYYKTEAARSGRAYAEVHAARMAVVQAAYAQFRAKWDPALPEQYPGVQHVEFAALRARPPLTSENEASLSPSTIEAEWL
jgi:GT2 family glycosyltransferase